MEVRSIEPIQEGDEITMAYPPLFELNQSAASRNATLKFECQCDHCSASQIGTALGVRLGEVDPHYSFLYYTAAVRSIYGNYNRSQSSDIGLPETSAPGE